MLLSAYVTPWYIAWTLPLLAMHWRAPISWIAVLHAGLLLTALDRTLPAGSRTRRSVQQPPRDRHSADCRRPRRLPRLHLGASVATREGVREWWRAARPHVLAALPAWVTARVIVLASLWLAHVVSDPTGFDRVRLDQGLLGWDADWYYDIATRGYDALSDTGPQVLPALPGSGQARLASLHRPRRPGTLLLLSNGPALAVGALAHRLALRETGDEALARRAAWFIAISPPAFVLVMGYSEPIALTVALGGVLALRQRRWEWAALAFLVAGITRPVGMLLAVPAAIEAASGMAAGSRPGPVREPAARRCSVRRHRPLPVLGRDPVR